MAGLDLNHQAGVNPAMLKRLAAVGSPLSKILVDLLVFYVGTVGVSRR
jgi:inosine-uridine nucleoside N-ribohydrolase